jgi:hypothetical protein
MQEFAIFSASLQNASHFIHMKSAALLVAIATTVAIANTLPATDKGEGEPFGIVNNEAAGVGKNKHFDPPPLVHRPPCALTTRWTVTFGTVLT